MNGETDDEDMEDGEMGFDDASAQVKNIRDPGQPTATTSRRLEHWRERLHKLVKKGVRLCRRDRQLKKVSPTGSSSVRWVSLPARPGH